jgi:hypothetical protein
VEGNKRATDVVRAAFASSPRFARVDVAAVFDRHLFNEVFDLKPTSDSLAG